ncbi:MAG: alkaline phosphatase D family protein [Acidobacteriota bacterium]
MKVHPPNVGPIIGHTTKNSVRLWGRGQRHGPRDSPRRVFGVAEVRREGKDTSETRFFKMLPKFDFTGIVEFSGLKSDKPYRYRMGYVLAEMEPDEIEAAQPKLDWGEAEWIPFHTAPASNGNISFVFGSCRYLSRFGLLDDRGDKTFRAVLERIADQPIQSVLMLGDQIYGDDLNFIAPNSRRKQFLRKYRRAFEPEYIRRLMARVPTYMILDDHEIRDNWNRDQLNDSPENRDLYAAAMGAYQSYQVVHGPAFQLSKDPKVDVTPRKYWYTFECGRARFFVMDTRTERSPSQKRMINREQMRALKEWMLKNKKKVKFVATSVPFFPDRRNKSADSDKWAAYSAQRAEILEHVRTHKVQPLLFLTGDVHTSGWATVTCSDEPGLEIHQLISSPFYFPTAPGSRSRFDNLSVIEEVDGRQYRVTESEYFTNLDNYSLVELAGSKLRLNCYGRKNMLLGEKVFDL